MAINLASKYASKVDERFKEKELTGYGLNTDYNWDNVDTITVYSIDTAPLNDYVKSGTSRYGTPEELGDTTASYKLTTDKSFTFTIDEFYKKSQMGAKQENKSGAKTPKSQVPNPPILIPVQLTLFSSTGSVLTMYLTSSISS